MLPGVEGKGWPHGCWQTSESRHWTFPGLKNSPNSSVAPGSRARPPQTFQTHSIHKGSFCPEAEDSAVRDTNKVPIL